MVILFVAFGVLSPGHAEETKDPLAPVTETAPAPATAPEKTTADLIDHVTLLSERFSDLQRQIETVFDTAKIHQDLLTLSEKLEDLSWDITFLQSGGHRNYNQLAYYKKELSWREHDIKAINGPLSDAVKLITTWKSDWEKEQKQLAEWRAVVEAEESAGGGQKAYANFTETIESANELIARRLKPLLDADQTVGDLQVKIHALDLNIDRQMKVMREAGFQKNAPSMISKDYFSRLDRQTWVAAWQGIANVNRLRLELADVGGWLIIPLLGALLILTFLIHLSGRSLAEDAQWRVFSRRPVSTGIMLSAPLVASFFINLPPFWLTFIRIVTLIAALRLARGLLPDVWEKRLFTQVAVLLLITGVLSIINVPAAVMQLSTFLMALIGIVFCLWHARRTVPSLVVWALRLGAIVLSCVLAAEISGYAAFSYYLFSTSLLTVFQTFTVWVLFLVAGGAIELAFHKSPAPLIQRNASAIVSRLTPLLIFCFTVYFLASFLVIWRFYTSEWEAAQAILSLGVDMGAQRVTLGLIASAIGVLYGAVLASRAVQAMLLQKVMPTSNMESGVQYSIARLVHYAVVTIGFLMALHVLGFGMTNLTILGSALGVGIGFGLQAIVVNFASGLILLFERPIKVGDTIQIGEQLGEVRNLGLRATVIQTFDSAEIVVPNSDLITGQLTNWTLGERCVRVKIPVGVAYGSDVARVMGLLMSCAYDNGRVLKDPGPEVLFLAFGSSSLDFELRVWIGEFTDRRKAQSDINQAIELKLRKAGIEIPFPQQDVHVRSLPESFNAEPEEPDTEG